MLNHSLLYVRYTEFDAIIYGHLCTILVNPLPYINIWCHSIKRNFPKLVSYVKRIDDKIMGGKNIIVDRYCEDVSCKTNTIDKLYLSYVQSYEIVEVLQERNEEKHLSSEHEEYIWVNNDGSIN